jgi:hypothetical protein
VLKNTQGYDDFFLSDLTGATFFLGSATLGLGMAAGLTDGVEKACRRCRIASS